MDKKIETRAYSFEIRADEGYNITGRPIVYNSKTDLGYFDEIIERGALDKADLRDVRFLVNHDTKSIPLARSRRNNANSTMQMTTDDEGMMIRVTLDVENNTEARNLYSAIKRGDITGMSFCFSVDDERWENLDTDHPTRHILSISNVSEVSAVTFPAYEATTIQARSKEALDNARAALDKAEARDEEALDSAINAQKEEEKRELELLKAKIRIYGGITK